MNYVSQLEGNKKEWLNSVKSGNSKALELVYRAYRLDFIQWLCAKTSANEEIALDIFQESVLALYKNAKLGRLDNITSSIKTYLFAIGKRIFLYLNRQHKIKTDSLIVEDLPLKELIVLPAATNSLTDKQQIISELVGKLRPNCKNILYLFYYENHKLKEIAERLNYKNTNVVKVMKVRCMEALRKLATHHIKISK